MMQFDTTKVLSPSFTKYYIDMLFPKHASAKKVNIHSNSVISIPKQVFKFLAEPFSQSIPSKYQRLKQNQNENNKNSGLSGNESTIFHYSFHHI